MTGLEQYIKKNGKHFSRKLLEHLDCKWTVEEIELGLKGKVYYNTTASTIEDITYLTSKAYYAFLPENLSKNHCIDYALSAIGGTDLFEGLAFSGWAVEEIMKDSTINLEEFL